MSRTIEKVVDGKGMLSKQVSIVLAVRWPVGGIRTYLKYTYGQLDPAEFAITLVAPDIAETGQLATDLARFEPAVVRTVPRPGPVQFARAACKAVAAQRPPRVIHSQGLTAGVCAIPAARMYATRHLCTVHDIFQDRQFAGATGRLKQYALGVAVRSLDVLQLVGRDAADNLAAFMGSPDNIAVIPNGIDTAAIARDTGVRDLRSELGCGPHDYLIGFFGRFMSQKGFRYLALALQQLLARGSLPRRPLVVAVGGGGFVREEQEWLRSEGLIQHFRFLPFEASIARTLRAMDIVAVPSLWEACPLLPMEAMVAGVPLVGSSCVGLREVLQGGPAVMVPPRDPAAMAGALLAAMAEDRATSARAYMAEAARRFDVATTARALRERLLALAT